MEVYCVNGKMFDDYEDAKEYHNFLWNVQRIIRPIMRYLI